MSTATAGSAFPKTMKAAVLTELRKPLEIAEITLPETLQLGQVLVRIHYSGICGSQLGEIDGAKGPDKFLPHLLGHEASATVVAVGAGVKTVKPDDTVVLHWRKGEGLEGDPPIYHSARKRVNAGWIATFNEYAIIAENRMTAIPRESDLEVASLFGCAVTTGFGVVENNARVRIGEAVVVFGAGGIGLNVIQAAAMVSANQIIAVDVFDNRLELASRLGATHAINSKKVDAKAEILAILGSQGLDVFVDNTGVPAIIEMGYEITKPEGRVVLVGVPRKGNNISIYSLPLHFGKGLSGSFGGGAIPQADIPRLHAMYRDGKLDLKPLIAEKYPLERINDAIDDMRSGKMGGRCLIEMPSVGA